MSEEDWISKPVVAHKWADEEEDDVKDNWDDEDEEEDSKASSKSDAAAEAPKPAATAGKKKKGKFLKEKIAQKELEEQNRKPKTAEELAAQKLEAMRLQQESDLEVARDSLGLGGSDASVLGSVRLNTKKDFEEFAKALNDKLSAYTRSPHYIVFLESLFRDLAAGLETDDIKKLDNVLTTLFNEKIKTQKQTTKKKKKNQEIKVERDDDYTYNDNTQGYDDYDDFI